MLFLPVDLIAIPKRGAVVGVTVVVDEYFFAWLDISESDLINCLFREVLDVDRVGKKRVVVK